MAVFDWFRGLLTRTSPRAATQSAGGGVLIDTPEKLAEVMRGDVNTGSGAVVTPGTAMRVAAVFACVRIISGAVATMPLQLKRWIDQDEREDASDDPLWQVIGRKPNRWQTPSQFKRMQQAHLLLRGNAYARIVRGVGGRVLELVPLHPDRVECKQGNDLALTYTYSRKDGVKVEFKQDQILHLTGLTLDGVHGVSVITYARETIGLAMAQEDHGANTFKNGARISNVLSHPHKLGTEGLKFLQESLSQFRAGGENEGKDLILEEGMEVKPLAMTAEDAQWIESRKFSRSEIAMFFGVPPHMIGDTEKSTSWGSGIEEQKDGFVAFTLEDHLVTWEETIARDLITDPAMYVRFNRAALVRGNLKARMESHALSLQWGILSPNEVRALEDRNPREDGKGDKYYDPPNTAGGAKKGSDSEPAKPA
jgi:HK97 family phage portal protein